MQQPKMNAWVLQKERSMGEVLERQGSSERRGSRRTGMQHQARGTDKRKNLPVDGDHFFGKGKSDRRQLRASMGRRRSACPSVPRAGFATAVRGTRPSKSTCRPGAVSRRCP